MKPIILAHRGYSGNYPENTMLAFQKAYEAGCDGIELDVQFTSDHEIVIIHDETINRTSHQKGAVKDFTYEELSKIDFSYKFDVPFQKIPTLREYLEWVKDLDIITNIELKTSIERYPGIEEAVYSLLCEYNLQKKVILSSFNHESVLKMKELDSTLVCGFLTECWLLKAGEYTASYHIEGYHPRYTALTLRSVAEMKAHNVRILPWTVNKEKDMIRLIDMGVDALITNYPDKAKKMIEQKKEETL